MKIEAETELEVGGYVLIGLGVFRLIMAFFLVIGSLVIEGAVGGGFDRIAIIGLAGIGRFWRHGGFCWCEDSHGGGLFFAWNGVLFHRVVGISHRNDDLFVIRPSRRFAGKSMFGDRSLMEGIHEGWIRANYASIPSKQAGDA